MSESRIKSAILFTPVLIVLLLDQWSKHVIRTSPDLHRTDIIEGVLAFHYTQNPGMAMGISWADTWVISLIAITATILISFYIYKVFSQANRGFLLCMGLILGGALGNIADRLTMARIEDYGGVLDGHVVDFIHFNLTINDFAVFPYIFNVADIAISVAIISLLVFYKKLMPDQQNQDNPGVKNETPDEAPTASGSN